jgi:predicted MPP superfamily phosphohydrolase
LTLLTALPTAAAGVGGFAYAHEIEPDRIDIHPVSLTLPRLTPAFDGFRLVQISDIHMDGFMTERRLLHIVDLVNRLEPDLVALTGDFVTFDPAYFADGLIATLRRLSPRVAALAVLGNHDHWTDAPTVRAIVDESDLINVCNDVYTVRRGGESLHFGGIDDYWERQDRLDQVLERMPPGGAAILLAHEPDFADISAATGRFDLQLSGHSHGGQVIIHFGDRLSCLPTAGSIVGRYQVGSMIQYTNRGVGMIPPQVRFNCRPEITVFTLRAPTRSG